MSLRHFLTNMMWIVLWLATIVGIFVGVFAVGYFTMELILGIVKLMEASR